MAKTISPYCLPDDLVDAVIPESKIEETKDSLPGKPNAPVATNGTKQASVAFTPPTDKGSGITQYRITSTPGSIKATGTTSPIVVTGLTTGTPYTFKVEAKTSAGWGPASNASNSVTPT